MKILCVGGQGQVARALNELANARGLELLAQGRPELDLLKPTNIRAKLESYQPNFVVNAAAYTAVDAAETDLDAARDLNHIAAGMLAEITAQMGIPIAHLSTDYVFSGQGTEPYRETDSVAPTGVYGQTKLDGEIAVAQKNPKHLILRTAWVYSATGKNFVKTMLRLAADREELTIVDDQFGNPTSALDIAAAILSICATVIDAPDFSAWGTYHLAGTGTTSWAGFATEIFNQSKAKGGPSAIVTPIPSEAYPTPAKRPANSRLSCRKLEAEFNITLPPWQNSLDVVLERLLTDQESSQ